MVDWKMGQRVGMLFCAVMIGCGATPTASDEEIKETPAKREQVLDAMKAELERSRNSLKFKDYDAPYYIAYRLKDIEQRSITGKFGSIIVDSDERQRYVYTEVRVGDYAFDNHANIDNEAFRLSEYQADKRAPLDENLKAIRGTLWLLTDEAYKKALSDYLTKKGGAVYATEDKTNVDSFSKEKPSKFRGAITPVSFDEASWSKQVKALTKKMRDADGILDAIMDVGVTKTTRYLVTSEGTTIVDDIVIYSIQLEAMTRADDGMALENSRTFYARTQDGLPDPKTLEAEVDQMLRELQELRAAPVIDPYTGPAILMPEAAGVLFHEAVGHRLEGERQQDEEEGRTFKGRIGKTVIPEFLSVFDDPTLDVHSGVQLNGTYRYDDEGVGAKRASLIGAGKLQGFLKSRTPIEGAPSSNGHGRAQGTLKPMARMANLVVEADPSKSMSYDELKRELMAEAKRQGKPFGLIIKDITGGSTNTSGYGYQAFKGEPILIYKVDPDTGEETLVRGAEIVGTPLVSINKIVAASTETGVFNGYCGAESGYVPVSAVAPALLTTELELQRSQSKTERPPLLAPPWK